MSRSLHELRKIYQAGLLDERDVDPDPVAQFLMWFDQVSETDSHEANAMIVSTVSAEGKPSARTVLLKHVDQAGFVFYTNYDSRKGQELAANPSVSLVFYWPSLERQVRVSGTAQRTSALDSDAYFLARPAGSQLSAMASPQSRVVPSRAWLEARISEIQVAGASLNRPDNWGGYVVAPDELEFWQGRPDRVHDRIRYRRDTERDLWIIERLAP